MTSCNELEAALAELKNLIGWRALENYMQERIKEYTQKIIKADASDVVLIATLQGKIKSMELVINKVNTAKQEG